MSVILAARHLIPRWRSTSTTLEMNEAFFSKTRPLNNPAPDLSGFEDSVTRWRDTPTAGHLGDILAFYTTPQLREKLKDIAREAIQKSVQATNVQLTIINTILGGDEHTIDTQQNIHAYDTSIQNQVHLLRKTLMVNPSNPIALLDIAKFQLTSGKQRDAERSLLTALTTSPNNRLVLRTLSRFYVHVKDPERAHRLIRAHPRTPTDPWLMASELALAEIANAVPKFASRGFKFVKNKAASDPDLSELAGALGGMELKNGSIRRARELFRVALLSPNDNVIAQAIASQNALSIDLSQPVHNTTSLSAAEVQTLLAWQALDLTLVEPNATAWHFEEPFSGRPIQCLTTLYALENQFEKGMTLVIRGLRADPNDPALLANMAYLLANANHLNKAEGTLKRLSKDGTEPFDAIVLATKGLIAMKRRAYILGDQLYLEALNRFRRHGNLQLMSACYAYYARAAAETLHPKRIAILKSATEQFSKIGCADAAIILRGLGQKIELTDQAKSARRLSQWIYDQKRNILEQRSRVTKPGESSLVLSKH